MLPLVQTYVAFPAGIGKMPRVRFHIYTTIGSFIWYLCLAWVGMKLGQSWNTDPRLQEAFHRFHLVVELALSRSLRGSCGCTSSGGRSRE